MLKALKKYRAPYLFIMPFFILFLVFQLVPTIWTFYISLTNWKGIGTPDFCGFDNYRKMLIDDMFWESLGNTVVYWLTGLVFIICCALLIACIDTLRQEGIEPVGFWYNPNIHPMKEYKMRKNTLVEYAKSIDLKLEIENEYGLRKFIEAVYPNWDNRCATCYALRFEETARYAAEHGYDRFTSTLFVSPYQNHELMRQICEQMAEKYGVEYLHRDFSPRFREGQDKARELGLYMQNYCGCVFSEEDRYRKRKKKKKPDAAQA